MLNIQMALSLGAKKLKEYLAKNNFKFKISVADINKWLSEKGHNDLEVYYDHDNDEIGINLKK